MNAGNRTALMLTIIFSLPISLHPPPSFSQDASMNAGNHTALMLTIIFSLLISLTGGLGVIALIVYFGIKYLARLNQNMETAKKVRGVAQGGGISQVHASSE